MTITATAPADAGQAEETCRGAYTAGLRALADVLDGHPEVPLPYHGTGTAITISDFLFAKDPRAALAAAARALPCNWSKDVRESEQYGSYLDLIGELHGLSIKLTAYRDAVCERVVTGTREVTETVKDPDALAAVPEVEVTKIIEDVTWRCGSILALAPKDAA